MLVVLCPLVSPETITQCIHGTGQSFLKGNFMPHAHKPSHKSESLFSKSLLYSQRSSPRLRELCFMLYKGVPIISVSNLNYFLKEIVNILTFFQFNS